MVRARDIIAYFKSLTYFGMLKYTSKRSYKMVKKIYQNYFKLSLKRLWKTFKKLAELIYQIFILIIVLLSPLILPLMIIYIPYKTYNRLRQINKFKNPTNTDDWLLEKNKTLNEAFSEIEKRHKVKYD